MEYEIRLNTIESRFEALHMGKVIGFVTFFVREDKSMVVPHTEVNAEYEGQGIAGALTKDLLDYARENSFPVEPLCPYTKTYITRHPEYQDLVK